MNEEVKYYIEKLLNEHIGFDTSSITPQIWARAVKSRMEACGVGMIQEYYNYLSVSNEERQELIELLVVPETWFFRESDSLDFISLYVKKNWISHTPEGKKVLRVLSMPCSSGEEPYSIAITLFESGMLESEFVIDAVDISYNALKIAEKGIYTEHSFRSKNTTFVNTYFDREDDHYVLKDFIRKQVHFHYGNVVNPLLLEHEKPYDIIFCRNLLIYFNLDAQKQVLRFFEKHLKPNGLVILGSSETGLLKDEEYSIQYPLKACVFQKKEKVELPPPSPPLQSPRPKLKSTHSHRKKSVKSVHVEPTIESTKSGSKLNLEERLALKEISSYADQGKLIKAKELCLEWIKKGTEKADFYFLLGILQQACDEEEEGEISFLKAAYLNPNHYESLVSLAIISEKKGDSENATLYRKRAEKALNLILNQNKN